MLAACGPQGGEIEFVPTSFEAEDRDAVAGELGFVTVDRGDDAGGVAVTLAIARLPSRQRTDAYPILYLAGGPGAAGIHPERMPLLDALRDYGDVYTYDHRGAGRSRPLLDCPNVVQLPPGSAPGPEELLEMYREQARGCAAHWRRQGIELSDVHTLTSVGDIETIRRAIGADKLRLVGASYGTHLALAYARGFADRIDRLVLAMVEGPDDTIKLPANTDAHLQKVSDLIAADEVGGQLLPDFAGVVGEAIRHLEQEPLAIEVEGAAGPQTYMLTALDLRRAVAGMIGRRFSIQFIVESFAPIAAGDFSPLADFLPSQRQADEAALRAAVDCASGASASRRELIAEQSVSSLLGTAADFPYPDVCDAWGVDDLGEEFRSPVSSSIPALFVSGDLDGRTPIGNAEAVMAGFPESSHIIVEGVGHEGFIFFAAPELLPLIGAFMEGEMPSPARLRGPTLVFSIPPVR